MPPRPPAPSSNHASATASAKGLVGGGTPEAVMNQPTETYTDRRRRTVPRWVKEKLEEQGVDIASLVRKKLIEEAERLEEKLEKLLEFLKEKLEPRVDLCKLTRIVDEERKNR